MRVVSVCSGAGGKDLGFRRAGFQTVALCEFDAERRRMLARNFPGVPCWPDLTELDAAELPACDVLIGGTPCQDLSHAGRRAGLDGERSGLFWHYMRVRNALGVPWAVWENVEGALSSNAGLDFACVLGAFVGADVVAPADGWPSAGVAAGPWGGCVWRVLDAQHFGVPQRRRRVFVAGHLGGPCPPEVLLEPARGAGDLAQGRRPRTLAAAGPLRGARDAGGEPDDAAEARIAATLTSGSSGDGVSAPGRRQEDDVNLIAPALVSRYGKGTDSDASDALVVNALDRQAGGADDNSAQANHIVVPPLVSGSSRGKPTPLSPGHNGADGHLIAATLKASGLAGGRTNDIEATYVTGLPCDADADQRRGQPDARRELLHGGGELRGEPVRGAARERDERRAENGRREAGAGLRGGDDRVVGPATDADRMRAADGLAGSLDGAVSAFDPKPDGRRYAACGDGVAAPVAEWIARRLASAASGESGPVEQANSGKHVTGTSPPLTEPARSADKAPIDRKDEESR